MSVLSAVNVKQKLPYCHSLFQGLFATDSFFCVGSVKSFNRLLISEVPSCRKAPQRCLESSQNIENILLGSPGLVTLWGPRCGLPHETSIHRAHKSLNDLGRLHSLASLESAERSHLNPWMLKFFQAEGGVLNSKEAHGLGAGNA